MKTPTSKNTSRFVTRILDRTATPAYVIRSDHLIAYANQACATWVGIELEQLIGAKCVFASQSQSDELGDKLQGLCPPPSFFETSLDNQQLLVWAIDQNQKTVWRSAAASRLQSEDAEAESTLGILIVCGDVCEPPSVDPIDCVVDPDRLHQALAQIRTQTDRIYSVESLVGISPYSDRIRRQVETAVCSNADLLIHGPRGTGKEHLARTIHAGRAHDQGADLLPVHCSIADQQSIQQTIKDFVASRESSQSFSEPSATSATGRATDSAENRLLLLDVDLLGEAAQSELLGFLQLPDFPVGTIATASQCLIQLAEQGSYSQQLAFRLATMSIKLVPLCDRQADVPLLAQALLERDNAGRDRQLSGFTKKAIELLSEFNWPENIDQLNRTIQSAATETNTSQIDVEDLPDQFTGALSAMRIGTATETSIQLDAYLAGIEKQLVERALKQAKGNKTKAAKLLGISRPKLLRRVQFFELDSTSPDFSEIIEPAEETDASKSEESQP